MRLASLATSLLGVLTFLSGSFLIFYGMSLWVNSELYGLIPLAPLGAFFTFLSLPLALFGFDSLQSWVVGSTLSSGDTTYVDKIPFFSNKRIVGLSLMITGAVWLALSLSAIWATSFTFVGVTSCPLGGCRSIFSYLGTWIVIGIGILLLAAVATLILMSRSKGSAARQQLVRASVMR